MWDGYARLCAVTLRIFTTVCHGSTVVSVMDSHSCGWAQTQVTENASDVRVAQKTNVHDISSSSNESSTNIVSTAVALKPTRIPRRPRSKIALPSGKHGTLDNFVTRRNESPATKRKHSTESSSPSSVQVAKTTKTDGSDEVS